MAQTQQRPPPMGGPGGPGGPPPGSVPLPPNFRPGMPLPPGVLPPGFRPPPPMPMPVNPEMQALLDSLPHNPVALHIHTQPTPGQPQQVDSVVLCPPHKRSACDECGVDFNAINHLQQYMKAAPNDAVPPPPQMQPPPQRAEQIKNAKEQGNVAFKAQNFPLAVQHYSRSADMALSRPPWELAAISRDETAIALCNRSAAFAFAGQWTSALADAEGVVMLKRPWTKGHFRKARAYLGMDRLEEARQALIDGLQFEPDDTELNNFLKEIDEKLASQESA